MSDTAGNEQTADTSETIQMQSSSMTGAKLPDDSMNVPDPDKLQTKEENPKESSNADEAPSTAANPQAHIAEGARRTEDPDNQSERVETTMEREYETIEGGTKKHVKSSVTELKEFTHKVHRTMFNDSPDSTSVNISEITETARSRPKIPVKTSAEYLPKLPRTPVVSSVKMSGPRPVFIERTIDANRSTDSRSRTMSNLQIGAQSPSTSAFVPIQLHEELKKSYEREIAELKNIRSTTSPGEPETESKEEMTRRVIQMEADLRDSKNLSDIYSEEIKTSRKQYEYMLTKNVQLENTVRALQEKIKDYKVKNKQLVRDTQERDMLLEKLHDTSSQLKRLERFTEKMEDERNMLIKDYEILRQSHMRNDQQLHGYKTERAELLRRIDMLEYDKQQLEFKLMDERRRERAQKYRSGSTTSRKTHSYRTSVHRAANSAHQYPVRASSLPYGEIPITVPADTLSNNPITRSASGTHANEPVETEVLQGGPGWSREVTEHTTPVQIHGETGEDQTIRDSPAVADNPDSMINTDTLTIDPASQPVTGTSPVDTAAGASSPHRIHTDGRGPDQVGGQSTSPTISPELHGVQRQADGPRQLSPDRNERIFSQTDSQDEELAARHMHSSIRIPVTYDDARYASPKTYHVKRRSLRRAGDYYVTRTSDIRADPYSRLTRSRRPTSAYGFVSSRYATRDIDVFPSPLPPRSATSLGRSVILEHVRSPDREYSRMHRSPIRRTHGFIPYMTLSPDPFQYEPIRSARSEVSRLEAQLDELKREKRRLEKQYNSTQTSSRLRDNLRRRDELCDRIVQVSGEIRHLQLKLNSLY